MKLPSLRSVLALSSLVVLAAPFAAGCSADTSSADAVESEESDLTTKYGNLLETLEGEDYDRWIAVRSSLKRGLDRKSVV